MSPRDVYVSDKRGGTVAAVKRLKRQPGWLRFKHQILNRSAGEIANSAGYNTNAIAAKWPILNRRIKKMHGGTLPRNHDRTTWVLPLKEFHYRQVVSEASPNDYGHTLGSAAPEMYAPLGHACLLSAHE